jgi:hypothetical protein
VENDRQESVIKLAQAHGMPTETVHATLIAVASSQC